MASEKQISANRKNATKSTGPRSEGGKGRSSQNSRTYGLFAAQVIGPGEDPKVYEAFYDALYTELNPVGALEEQLAEQIIGRLWRLRRVPEIEAAILAHYHHTNQRDRAQRKASAQEEPTFQLNNPMMIRDNRAHKEAEQDRDEAIAALDGPLPMLGAAFRDAEPLLSRLTRIASSIEASLFRALKELKAMQTERQETAIEGTIVEEQRHTPPPRYRERPQELN